MESFIFMCLCAVWGEALRRGNDGSPSKRVKRRRGNRGSLSRRRKTASVPFARTVDFGGYFCPRAAAGAGATRTLAAAAAAGARPGSLGPDPSLSALTAFTDVTGAPQPFFLAQSLGPTQARP